MTGKKISDKHLKTYYYLIEYIREYGYPPTLEEIRIHFKMKSKSTPYSHLVKLQIAGLIQVKDHSPRAIQIIGYTFVNNDCLKKAQ